MVTQSAVAGRKGSTDWKATPLAVASACWAASETRSSATFVACLPSAEAAPGAPASARSTTTHSRSTQFIALPPSYRGALTTGRRPPPLGGPITVLLTLSLCSPVCYRCRGPNEPEAVQVGQGADGQDRQLARDDAARRGGPPHAERSEVRLER